MANRIPLVLDETNGRLQELPNGDDLNLAGNNIIGLTSLTTTSGITVGGSIDVVGSANANIVNSTNGNFTNVVSTNGTIANLTATTVSSSTVAVGTTFTVAGSPLADVAFTGSYLDLVDQPVGLEQVQSDWAELNPDSIAFIQNKPAIPGNLLDLGIFDGTVGQFLRTDGNGNFTFVDPPATGSTVSSFTDLDDVPASYTGFAGNVLAVNGTQNGLIYFDLNTLSLTSLQVTNALGFTPYNATNPANYINDSSGVITALGFTPYNGTANPLGFLTSESDTLDSVTDRASNTTNVISVGGLNSTGSIAIDSGNLSIGGNIEFNQTSGTITVDGGGGSTLQLGQNSILKLSSSSTILQSATMIPDLTAPTLPNLGTSSARYGDLFVQTINMNSSLTHADTMDFTVANDLNISSTSGNVVLDSNRAITMSQLVNFFGVTAAQRATITGEQSGDVVYVSDDRLLQLYVANFDGATPQWVSLNIPYGPEPSVGTIYPGMLAVADGTAWDPAGDGQEHLMCYLNGAFVQVV